MPLSRVMVVVVIGLAVGFGAANCGSDDDSKAGGSGLFCPSSGGSSNTCTAAESKAYEDCITNRCDTEYKQCLGANYKSGSFSGACATYFNCLGACSCSDQSCRTNCATSGFTAECVTCATALGTCVSNAEGSCTRPACASGAGGSGAGGSGAGGSGAGGSGAGGSGGGTGCAALTTCCAAITNATFKTQCTMVASQNNDQLCSAALTTFRAGSLCP